MEGNKAKQNQNYKETSYPYLKTNRSGVGSGLHD